MVPGMLMRSACLTLCLVVLLGGCARSGGTRDEPRTPAAPAATPSGEDALTLSRLASEAYAKQDWATSERHYVALTTKVPADVEPWFKLGNIYARTDRFDLAVRAYREVLVRDTRHARAWHNMGVVQLRQAARTFEELQKYAAPDDPLASRGTELGRDIARMLAPAGDQSPP